jgi:phosphatidylglycerophosphate synthase
LIKYPMSEVATSAKARDCWWTVLVVDPIASRMVWLLANFTRVSPLVVTIISLGFYTLSAALLALYGYNPAAMPWAVYVAALSYLFAFVLDCVDGKLARLIKKTTKVGRYLDRIGGVYGETIVLAAFIYASITVWPLIPVAIIGGVYWSGIMVEFVAWCFSPAQPPQAVNSSRGLHNSLLRTLDNWLKKHRLGAHPSAVEGGVLAFGLSPFFHLHPAFIAVGAVLVWIEQFRFLIRHRIIGRARREEKCAVST